MFIFSEIVKIAKSNFDKTFWIGLTDKQTEGKWLFDSNDQEANFDEMIYKWRANEPNNYRNNEDCVHTWGINELNDVPCSNNEVWGKPIHGLCEIKADNC